VRKIAKPIGQIIMATCTKPIDPEYIVRRVREWAG
jgi:hypothetical protein